MPGKNFSDFWLVLQLLRTGVAAESTRHLDRGLITTDEVDALLASLPDEAEECEPCETVFEHTTEPAGEPMIEEALPLD